MLKQHLPRLRYQGTFALGGLDTLVGFSWFFLFRCRDFGAFSLALISYKLGVFFGIFVSVFFQVLEYDLDIASGVNWRAVILECYWRVHSDLSSADHFLLFISSSFVVQLTLT